MKRWQVMIMVLVAVGLGFSAGLVMPVEAGMSPLLAVESVQGVTGQVGGVWTYAQTKTELAVVAQTINGYRSTLSSAQTAIAQADSGLGLLATTYASLNDAIAAAPSNATYTPIKTEWAALVAEFQALAAQSTAMKDALEALP